MNLELLEKILKEGQMERLEKGAPKIAMLTFLPIPKHINDSIPICIFGPSSFMARFEHWDKRKY